MRIGLFSLDEARARAVVMLRDSRLFECEVATTPFTPSCIVKLPASVKAMFGEYVTVAAVGGGLLLARHFVQRSTRHPRLVKIGNIGFSTEVASHRFLDTVYEIEATWRSAPRPLRCASIWHYLVIWALCVDRAPVF